jgi:arsenite oxidase small subunit
MATLVFGTKPGAALCGRMVYFCAMDRRSFIESCTAGAACASAAAALPAFAADAKPREYPRALLVDPHGAPLKAAALKQRTNYVFHYPFEATPVFLLDLGKPALPHALSTKNRDSYAWPGGVGARRSIVAYSAICAHQLVYPTRDVSFISFRKTRAQRGVQDELIHCCAEHSQYDPARGAEVLSGPAPQPLCAVLLAHDPKADTLTAYATLGGELFNDFFKKYAMKLSLEVGPKAHNPVAGQAVVTELDKFCRNSIQC